MSLVVAFLALLAGAVFAVSVHFQMKGLAHTDDLTGTLISVATIAALLWLVAPFVIEWHRWFSHAALLFAVCGLIFPALGQRLSVASVKQVGPSLTAAIGAFAPVFAVVPAIILLGERMNLQAALGLAVMTGALILAAVGPRGVRFGRSALLLLLPLGASLVRGIIQPVAKLGYAEVNSPLFGTLVMASVSTLVLAIALAARCKPVSVRRGGYVWFGLAGVFIGLGILLWQFALSRGDVIVVAPLVSTTPLWAVVLGAFVFRHEKLGLRHAVVAALVVVGTVLITTR